MLLRSVVVHQLLILKHVQYDEQRAGLKELDHSKSPRVRLQRLEKCLEQRAGWQMHSTPKSATSHHKAVRLNTNVM